MIEYEEFTKILNKKRRNKLKDTEFKEHHRNKNFKYDPCNVYQQLKKYEFNFDTPISYSIIDKGCGVTRITPIFSNKTNFIYHYLTSAIYSEILPKEKRVPGTFGGWSLGGQIRNEENEEIYNIQHRNNLKYLFSSPSLEKEITELYNITKNEPLINKSYVDNIPYISPYNNEDKIWREYWKLFTKLAFDYRYKEQYNTFAKFDLANFYDTIDLNILEIKLRSVVSPSYTDEVNLLLKFLKQWNIRQIKNGHSGKGLPQDRKTDASRVLANFYINDLDHFLFNKCEEQNSLFIRFADDFLLFCPSDKEAKNLIYQASLYLNTLGLNINLSKVHFFKSKDDYDKYWSFEIHNHIDHHETQEAL